MELSKSEKEAFLKAKADWVGILTQLWNAIGKPIEKERLTVYVNQLGDIPMATLEKAISKMLREHTWNSVPTIGEIFKAAKEVRDSQEREFIYQFEKPTQPLMTYPDRSELRSAFDLAPDWWARHAKETK